ncbi:DUF4959 domain-containing protein [uncultured Proteiniphilum sp.]|uniref:DUF4959 domain-containing protein n=1 Tax=uncultured Proteiniphilum sp. TaxID=497637 RepID=UPI00261ACE3D|nr:DUF4959 domain-containing protein [uncultured Proteiniphilum sp.]
MKKYTFILVTLAVCAFFACDDDNSKRPTGGSWNTGPIEGYTVTPINGGATITYTIPNEPDILYVMAEYERNGKVFTEKSSVHKNSLTIEGFHRVDKVKATLYKVNKQEQRSEPVEVEFEPLESLIDIAHNSWSMVPGFGGIVAFWDNPKTTELGVRLMVKNEDNILETEDMYFTTLKRERHTFRTYEAVETDFAVSFEDKWGNISDTIRFTTTPLFEIMVPKPYADFRANIPWDNTTDLDASRVLPKLWDNIVNTSAHGWLTKSGSSGLSITIDLKQVVKLSRIVRHPYHLNSLYGQANITDFEAWGIDKIDYDKLADKPYWLDSLSVRWGAIHTVDPLTELPERTFKDDWVYLGRNTVPVGLSSADANAMAVSGVESEVPLDARPVRYVRIFVRGITLITPPPTSNYFSCSELTFYGDTSVPQE